MQFFIDSGEDASKARVGIALAFSQNGKKYNVYSVEVPNNQRYAVFKINVLNVDNERYVHPVKIGMLTIAFRCTMYRLSHIAQQIASTYEASLTE